MKLMHYLFSTPIDFSPDSVQMLVFENPSDFGVMTKELFDQIRGTNGRFTLIEDGSELPLDKFAVFIESPFSLESHYKSINQSLAHELNQKLLDSEFQERTTTLSSQLEHLLLDAIAEIDGSAMIDGIDLSKLVKTTELSFEKEEDIASELFEFCRLTAKLTKTKMVVLLNSSGYVGENQFENLIRNLRYLKISVLLVEKEAKQYCSYKLFDVDFCEIDHNNMGRYFFDV